MQRGYLIVGSIWISILIGIVLLLTLTPLNTAVISLTVFSALTQHWWGPLLFLSTYTVRPLLWLPITIFSIVSGAIFGIWPGLLVTMLGTLISAAVAHQVGWYFSALIPNHDTPWHQKARDKYPFEFVASLHLSLLPFDFVNYSLGLARIPFMAFIAGVALGMVPGTLSLTILGASLDVPDIIENGVSASSFDWRYFSIALVGIVTIWTSSYIYRQRKKRRSY